MLSRVLLVESSRVELMESSCVGGIKKSSI